MRKVVAVDMGYGFIKDTSDGESVAVHPAVVGTGHVLTQTPFGQQSRYDDESTIEYDGKLWFVGEKAMRQSENVYQVLDDSKVTDTTNRILLYSSLRRHVPRNGEASLVVGLPVAHRAKWQAPLTEMLQGVHRLANGYEVTVCQVKVVDQPVGTYLDGLLNVDGEVVNNEMYRMTVGVVDIGYRTTDIVVMREAESIEPLSGTINVAMSNAYESIGKTLRTKYGINPELWQLEAAVRNRAITIRGERHDISSIVNTVLERTVSAIVHQVNAHWRNDYSIDATLLTGGGSVAMADQLLKSWPNAINAHYPQVANVRGYYKLGRVLWD